MKTNSSLRLGPKGLTYEFHLAISADDLEAVRGFFPSGAFDTVESLRESRNDHVTTELANLRELVWHADLWATREERASQKALTQIKREGGRLSLLADDERPRRKKRKISSKVSS